MVDLTFEAKTPAGVSVPSGSVTVTGHVVYGTEYSDQAWNQSSVRTLDGVRWTYSNGIYITETILIVKGIPKSEGLLFRQWLRTKLNFGENIFDITSSEAIDLGEGAATLIEDLEFMKTSDAGVFQQKAPGIYNIKLPFQKKRA